MFNPLPLDERRDIYFDVLSPEKALLTINRLKAEREAQAAEERNRFVESEENMLCRDLTMDRNWQREFAQRVEIEIQDFHHPGALGSGYCRIRSDWKKSLNQCPGITRAKN